MVWVETRSESMISLGHGRAQLHDVTIGGTRDGRVTHYRLDILQDSGASAEVGAVLGSFMTRPMASGVYDIANIECRARSVLTNTTPIVAFRGAGRPEATAAIERAIDLFAAELGRDPAEIRRLNLIAPFSDPHDDGDRADLRRRRLRRRPRPCPRRRRLRRGAGGAAATSRVRRLRHCSASASASTSRSPTASPVTRRRGSKSMAMAAPSCTPAPRHTARATKRHGR